jgi:DnaJ-class molecular chaperone
MAAMIEGTLTWDSARALLGVAPDASEADVRAAYLEQVCRHPPDRDPEQFERVRDAYEKLRDPRQRARQVLEGPDPFAPLVELLGEPSTSTRRFVDVEHWLAVMKEKRT